MANGHGGYRPGAGRKTTAERFAGKIAAAEKRIADRLPDLIDNLFALADGVTVQETDKDGEVRIYMRPPCRQSNEYLINRILGKPLQREEQSGPDGGPVRVQVVDFGDCDDSELRERLAAASGIAASGGVPPKP